MLRHKGAILDEWCSTENRDPADIERSIGVGKDPGDVGAELIEAGATLFTVGIGGPSYDLGLLKDWIAWRDEQNAR